MHARKVSSLILVLALGCSLQVSAQLKTSLNLEAGTMWNMLKVDDPGRLFQSANVPSYVAGLTVGQEIFPSFSVATGLLYVPLRDGINMLDERPHQVQWSSSRSFLIPVRVEYRIQPSEFECQG